MISRMSPQTPAPNRCSSPCHPGNSSFGVRDVWLERSGGPSQAFRKADDEFRCPGRIEAAQMRDEFAQGLLFLSRGRAPRKSADEEAVAAIKAAFGPSIPTGRVATSPEHTPLCRPADDSTRSLPLAIAAGGRSRDDCYSTASSSFTAATPPFFFDVHSAGSSSPGPYFRSSDRRSRVSSTDRQTRTLPRQIGQTSYDFDSPPISPMALPSDDATRLEPIASLGAALSSGAWHGLEPFHGGRRLSSRASDRPHLMPDLGFGPPRPKAPSRPLSPNGVGMARGQSSYGAGEKPYDIHCFGPQPAVLPRAANPTYAAVVQRPRQLVLP